MTVFPKDMTNGDDRLLPSIMVVGMDSGLKLRDELSEAEAAVRRLRTELGAAEERVEIILERYKANEGFVRDVWETLKHGWLQAKSDEREAEVTPPVHASAEGGEERPKGAASEAGGS